MRRIEIKSWKATAPVKNEEGKVVDTKEIEENLLVALNNLVAAKRPEELPKGIDKFRIFNKLSIAFDKAHENGVLELEDREYNFLKETVEKDVPAAWGFNPHLSEAINSFMEAKEE